MQFKTSELQITEPQNFEGYIRFAQFFLN